MKYHQKWFAILGTKNFVTFFLFAFISYKSKIKLRFDLCILLSLYPSDRKNARKTSTNFVRKLFVSFDVDVTGY